MNTPTLKSQASILFVKNADISAAYYIEKLGFSVVDSVGNPPIFFLLRRDGCSLMLIQIKSPEQIVPNWKIHPNTSNAYFWVTDADALHKEFLDRGATIDYGPCDQPYGCREFGIQDMDGYDIAFGQVVYPTNIAEQDAAANP